MATFLNWLFQKESGQATAALLKIIVSFLAARHVPVSSDDQLAITGGLTWLLNYGWHLIENKIPQLDIKPGTDGVGPKPGSAV